MSNYWVIAILAVLLAGLGLWMWGYRRFAGQGSILNDRYTTERLLEPDQVQMLDYLRNTFPGQVVLPNIRLAEMLTITRSANPAESRKALATFAVDFVACGEDGLPVFAFDVERYHLSDAERHAEDVKTKNRILKAAGVRLVFLKNTPRRMPPPDVFRGQLNLAARPRHKEERRAEVREQLEAQFSQFDQKFASSEFTDSEVLGLSGLMNLDENEAPPPPPRRPAPRSGNGSNTGLR
ncbi:MAG: DUF2726 domain-containing protein [Burkholderiales bacterium]|nr:DUF2726 domain-containing protein [Burkholderiales bacterium]